MDTDLARLITDAVVDKTNSSLSDITNYVLIRLKYVTRREVEQATRELWKLGLLHRYSDNTYSVADPKDIVKARK